jgi:hypothetical protein
MKRYQVLYPADVGHHPGESDDLEEAGRIYLGIPGASDIYDRQERRYINPEVEVECVAEAFEKWHREQEAKTAAQNQEHRNA